MAHLFDFCNEELGNQAGNVLEDMGLSVKYHQLDISDEESRKRLAEFVKQNYPDGINVLVNNAEILHKLGQWTALWNSLREDITYELHGGSRNVHGISAIDDEEFEVRWNVIRDAFAPIGWKLS